QRSLKASKSLLQVTPLASVAVAPPLDSNQALSAAAFPFPSLSTELSEASARKSGSVVSTIVKVASVVLVLPQASVAVNITVAEPVAPQRSLKASKSLLQVTPLASVAVAPPLDSNQALSAAAFPFPSLSTELSEA